MRSKILFVILFVWSLSCFSQQYVVLLINETEKEMVVLGKRKIKDMLTLDFEYVGEAQLITKDGIYANYHKFPKDSIHSLVVKHGNLGAKFGLPFKAVGIGLGAIGALLVATSASSADDENTIDDDESSDALGQLLLGLVSAGAGTGMFLLGSAMGDRPVEKEKTTYYMSEWDVRIVEKRRVSSYRRYLKE